jgi:hypothetical protein
VGQLLPFLFICTCNVQCILFANVSTHAEVLRSLENVCLNRISKRDKKLEDSEPEERYFLPFGKEDRRIKFHIL